MEELNDSRKRDFYLYAQSIGGDFGMLIADKIEVKRVVLIAPGNNLAESFWESDSTSFLKKSLIRKGVNLNYLKKYWEEISADYSFKKKAKKTKFYVKLTKNDTCIPYKNGLKLLSLMRKKKVNYKLKTGFLSHPLFLLKECIFPRDSIGWLLEK